MREMGKVTKTEIFLLGLTLLFLFVILYIAYLVPADNYSVTTERQVVETGESIHYVNINVAAQEELEQLEGIGPTLAQRIVDYRDSHGEFTDVEQLLEIEGIGEKTLNNIRDLLILEEKG